MKTKTLNRIQISLTVAMLFATGMVWGQRSPIQYFRPYDQRGINVFETSKKDTVPYDGFALRIGANFTQQFQMLDHSNSGDVALYDLSPGFNLAMANFNIDAQLYDGVRVSLVSYMSSRHHNEFWVKGGYLQIDKVTFLHSEFMDRLWENLTLKIGHMEINYGDAHFRRSDGGNAIYNPFIENNLMDEFTTEIGTELYWQKAGAIVMLGMTDGEIQGSTTRGDDRKPSIYGKLGYDNTFGDNTRIRLTGSFYTTKSSINNTIFGGDRTGSHYYYALEPANATLTGNAFSGRINPGFRDNVTAFMINPFIKFGGLEFFGTYEIAKGNHAVENGEIQSTDNTLPTLQKLPNRKVTQFSGDLIYRFLSDKLYVGARYNVFDGTLAFGQSTSQPNVNQGTRQDVKITRTALAAGWFITHNIALKAEYVTQKYTEFPAGDIRSGGKFDGFVFEGTIGF